MSSQVTLFLLTVVLGMFIGFIFDIFRIIRKIIKHRDFFIFVEDTLYWLIVSFIMFYFMLNKNNGEIRFFSIIGVFIGMILYFCTISNLVINVSLIVINAIKKILIVMFKIIMFPIKIIYKIIKIPLNVLKKIVDKILKPVKKILQKFKRYVKIKLRKIFKELKVILKKT